MSCDIINIVFLGYAVAPEKADQYSGVSVAGNKMQTSIIKYLSCRDDINLKVISIRPVASFPTDKTVFLRKQTEKIFNVEAKQTGFINVPFVKQYTQSMLAYKELKKTVDKIGQDNTIILSFNMFPQVGKPTIKALKKLNVNAVSIIADLPIDYSVRRGFWGRLIYSTYNKKTENLLKQIKNIVVLNEYAAEKFSPQADYIVVEGGVDISEDTIRSCKCPNFTYNEKNLLYCGALHKYSGALTLAKAIKSIGDKDIFLDIYGDGEDRNSIVALAKEDSRIRYHGSVDNKTVLQKQREAFLLVNPRPVSDPISMVTFPSKIFEFLLSGTPVLSTKLNGFTPQYYDKLIFCNDETESGLAEGIKKVLSMNDGELEEYACKAYKFVVQEKNWKTQTNRLENYLRKTIVDDYNL